MKHGDPRDQKFCAAVYCQHRGYEHGKRTEDNGVCAVCGCDSFKDAPAATLPDERLKMSVSDDCCGNCGSEDHMTAGCPTGWAPKSQPIPHLKGNELTDVCRCGHMRVQHFPICSQGACDCEKFSFEKRFGEELPKHDPVSRPSHYTSGKIECIDALESALQGLQGVEAFCVGNAIKYLWRAHRKNGDEDLRKATWYINWLREYHAKQPIKFVERPSEQHTNLKAAAELGKQVKFTIDVPGIGKVGVKDWPVITADSWAHCKACKKDVKAAFDMDDKAEPICSVCHRPQLEKEFCPEKQPSLGSQCHLPKGHDGNMHINKEASWPTGPRRVPSRAEAVKSLERAACAKCKKEFFAEQLNNEGWCKDCLSAPTRTMQEVLQDPTK